MSGLRSHWLVRQAMIWSLIASLSGVGLFSGKARAQSSSKATQEFLMSATYGVLAGSLVGAASLAFTDRPGDHLQRIARGASLGLYTGILLGLYVIYMVPSSSSSFNDYGNSSSLVDPPAWALFPLLEPEHGLTGAVAHWQVLSF